MPQKLQQQPRLVYSVPRLIKPSLTSAAQSQVRHLIDRYQILALTKPAEAQWLMDFCDAFLKRHCPNSQPLTRVR